MTKDLERRNKARTWQFNRGAKSIALLAAVSLLATSCGDGGQRAEVRAEPAGSSVELGSAVGDDVSVSVSESDTDEAQVSTDPSNGKTNQPSNLGAGMEIQSFTLDDVPPITLPDVSVLSETGAIVKQSLGGSADPTPGLEVVSAQCAANGGELVYSGSDEAGSLLEGDGTFEIELEADGSGTYYSNPDGGNITDITINADGSGEYEYRGGPDPSLYITVNSDGSGIYKSLKNGRFETTFRTDIGILDPQLLVVGPKPVFAVADRFPPMAKLGSLRPPCVTIIRLDTTVLFDFDSDQLRPEASTVVENIAAALRTNAKPLEVHGHTDSEGDDDYNQDLSERRAASFATALIAQGVSTEIATEGFGETRPAAPNQTAEGADDPVGRQQNRRIEIVIPE